MTVPFLSMGDCICLYARTISHIQVDCMPVSIKENYMVSPEIEFLEQAIGENILAVDPLVVTDGGSHSHVSIIRTVQNEYVLRIPKGNQGFCTRFVQSHIDGSKWFDQRWATDKARELGIPAPKIIHSSRTPQNSDRFVVMERLIGEPIFDYEQWNGCPYDEKEFGEILGKLHDVKISGAGPIDDFGQTYFTSWEDFLRAMAERLLQICLSRGSISNQLHGKLQSEWLPLLNTLSGIDTRLLHLESLGFANILYDPSSRSITGFLDYEDCIGGDPVFEFAWMYYYYGHPSSNQPFFDYNRFLTGYGESPQFSDRVEIYRAFMWLDKLSWITIDSDMANGHRIELNALFSNTA